MKKLLFAALLVSLVTACSKSFFGKNTNKSAGGN